MAIDTSKLKKVYDTLKGGGYEQDYDSFKRGFLGNSNYENRKQVYNLLSNNGAQIGGFGGVPTEWGVDVDGLHTRIE